MGEHQPKLNIEVESETKSQMQFSYSFQYILTFNLFYFNLSTVN
jgi:hypothetical protein